MCFKHILLCLGIAFWGYPILAQELRSVDFIYLEGNNFIQGTIIDSLSDADHLVIDIEGAEPMIIKRPLVKEIQSGHHFLLTNQRGKRVATQGHFFEPSMTFLTAKHYHNFSDNLRIAVGAEFTYGLYLKPWLTAAAGTGINYYKEAIVPVFGQLRAYYPGMVSAPYVSLQGGYGIHAEKVFNQQEFESSKGGWFWQPSIGFRIASRGQVATHLSLGYRIQKVTYSFDAPEGWWTLSEKTKLTYRSLAFRAGLVF